jgi:hypothetical protein
MNIFKRCAFILHYLSFFFKERGERGRNRWGKGEGKRGNKMRRAKIKEKRKSEENQVRGR